MNKPIYTIRIDFGFGVDSWEGVGTDIEDAIEYLIKKIVSNEKLTDREVEAIEGLDRQFGLTYFYEEVLEKSEILYSTSQHEDYERRIVTHSKWITCHGTFLLMKSQAFEKDSEVPKKISDHPANFYYFEKVG